MGRTRECVGKSMLVFAVLFRRSRERVDGHHSCKREPFARLDAFYVWCCLSRRAVGEINVRDGW